MSRIKVANAPCSWGVLEFDLQGEAAGPGQVLAEMSQAGFLGTELGDWGFLPTEPDALREFLAPHSLELLGAFVPVALSDAGAHEEGAARAARTARLLAALSREAFIVLSDDNGTVPARTENAGRIGPQHGLGPEGWRHVARGVQRVAAAVKDAAGLRTVIHHHCGGYLETPDEVARLLEQTDPAEVGLCLDTGHWRFGGGDPLQALRQHRERIWHVHFKDCQPQVARRSQQEGWDYFRSVREGVFCELGQGEVDFAGLVAELERTGYEGWIVVEQDVLPGMGTPLESARRNREFLRSLGL